MQTSNGAKPTALRTRAKRWLVVLCTVSLSLDSCSTNTSSRHSTAPCHAGALFGMLSFTLPLTRPLIGLEVCSAVLNISNEEARELIENGCLFAFDLSQKQTRSLVRVITSSLANYVSQKTAPKINPDFESLFGEIFPSSPITIGTTYLSRRWSCDPDHVLNLWRGGFLRAAQGAKCRPGPGGSPPLDFQSVKEFMKGRLYESIE